MYVRALRGATTIESNSRDDILKGTEILLKEVIDRNNILKDDIISIIFSVTGDLDEAFPAAAARRIGLTEVALMCTGEINVPGSLEKCIRLMMHVNTEKKNSELNHIYLEGAKILRPDIASPKIQGCSLPGSRI